MEVDHIVTLSMARWQMTKNKKAKKQKKKQNGKKGNDKDQRKDRGVDAKPDAQVKECYVCGKRKVTSHKTTFSRMHLNKTVNELEGARMAADAAKKKCTPMKTQRITRPH